jgi:hypothetical protein
MAINYLNSIDLNQNELIHGTIENQASDALAGTPVEGQLYFNTQDHVLKVGREILPATNPKTYEWVEVGGGVEKLTTTQSGDSTGNTLTVLTDATGDVTINSFAYAGGDNIGYVPTGGTASNFLKGNGTWAELDNYGSWKLSAAGGATINISSGNTVDFVGTGTTTVSRASKTITINSADQYEGTVTSVAQTHGGNAFTVGGSPITASGTLAITMNGSSSQYIDGAGDLTTFPSIPSSFTVTLTGDVTGSGATGSDIATTISAEAVDFAMINTAAVVTAAEGIASNDNDTTLPTSAAVKAYADSLIVGGLIYQGGYDAATNTPDLDSSPSSSIKKGWTYTVTADGDFFTEQVRIGDVLIAEQNAPTALADWTTVQNNIDLADATTIGEGNVVPGASGTITAPYTNGTATLDVVDSTAAQKGAVIVAQGGGINVAYSNGTATVSGEDSSATNKGIVIVSPSDPIEVSYASGTATVGIKDSAATQKGAVIVSGGTGISVAYSGGTATVTSTVQSDNSFSGTIGDGTLTSLPITSATHGLGADSSSFMVQLVEVSSGETVYAGVTRGASGLVTIDFAVAPATNAIRVLIQKIG